MASASASGVAGAAGGVAGGAGDVTGLGPWAVREYVAISGGRIPCWVAGRGEPLVYLHSRGGLRRSGGLVALAERFTLFMPVLPGFDGTPRLPGAGSLAELGRLAADIVAAVAAGGCPVVGLSFGTRVAAAAALTRPDLVPHLVLESPTFSRGRPGGDGSGGAVPGGDRNERRDGTAGGAGPVGEAERALYFHPERHMPDGRDEAARGRNRATADSYASAADDGALCARMGELRCRALILHGVEDPVLPAEAVQRLKADLARSYLCYMYDAGHIIESDQPERFVRVVSDFLRLGEGFLAPWAEPVA